MNWLGRCALLFPAERIDSSCPRLDVPKTQHTCRGRDWSGSIQFDPPKNLLLLGQSERTRVVTGPEEARLELFLRESERAVSRTAQLACHTSQIESIAPEDRKTKNDSALCGVVAQRLLPPTSIQDRPNSVCSRLSSVPFELYLPDHESDLTQTLQFPLPFWIRDIADPLHAGSRVTEANISTFRRCGEAPLHAR
ncbi:hypothetical protein POX_b03439 [Penicillium oxalicum]|uniref:Uncharacterized protein n=1 Tax=Penicillium oxalicum (strain 114-2 / CGMCC 5302) TaxID=933388 RepID=S7ZFT1_PENO1|nr:hypothetical protein POX_b03439 [Penicillium oxalicum]EPS29535.1 hypothetical protein PDE_04485 [Penicillium oxalicum 114-2]KAI2793384.1 hypothetical protein POX_b03439 [Penicillium oxalicum]